MYLGVLVENMSMKFEPRKRNFFILSKYNLTFSLITNKFYVVSTLY